MKKILFLALTIGAFLAATSCKKDITETSTEQGAITLSYGISVNDDNTILSTRAMSDAELLESAVIEIYKPAFEGLARRYVGSNNIPNTIYLPATKGTDKYRVDVKAGEVVKATPIIASWDQPSYKGSTEFAVVAGNNAPTTIEVLAKISNAVTKVTFGDGIKTGDVAFTDYKVTIADEAGNSLVYTSAEDGKLGYFIISENTAIEQTLHWSFEGTLNNGETFTNEGQSFVVELGKQYNLNLTYTERDGVLSFTLKVDKSLDDIYEEIIFEPTSTGISRSYNYEIWASHATVHADVDITEYDPNYVYFEYTASNDGNPNWSAASRVAATGNKVGEEFDGTFSGVITGLTPRTDYSYRLVVKSLKTSEEVTIDSVSELTTDVAPTVPNGSLEEYHTPGDYPVFYASGTDMWWDSGNAGSSMGGKIICDIDTNEKMVGNASARLQSANAIIKFAAGNLFSGSFGGTVGTQGGIVNFGRPFVGRPSKLRLWIKYSTNKVTHTNNKKINKDNYDIGQVKVVLGTWDTETYGGIPDSPVCVNTTNESTFIDFNTDPATIAYGDLQITGASSAANYSANNNGTVTVDDWTQWHQVEIDLVYRDLVTMPTHIIISCAASKYGDYFEGCETSKMWVDGFELVYDDDIVTK
ncbi:MAG: PCMD domain-containing protein [Alistipes sp.]|nr:PCMD domain-containing protein [Alistipes sp.]MBQ6581607.1 PCMD domain-containing protein [Alistipes sp.]